MATVQAPKATLSRRCPWSEKSRVSRWGQLRIHFRSCRLNSTLNPPSRYCRITEWSREYMNTPKLCRTEALFPRNWDRDCIYLSWNPLNRDLRLQSPSMMTYGNMLQVIHALRYCATTLRPWAWIQKGCCFQMMLETVPFDAVQCTRTSFTSERAFSMDGIWKPLYIAPTKNTW